MAPALHVIEYPSRMLSTVEYHRYRHVMCERLVLCCISVLCIGRCRSSSLRHCYHLSTESTEVIVARGAHVTVPSTSSPATNDHVTVPILGRQRGIVISDKVVDIMAARRVMMHMVDDVHLAMANVLGHPCDNRLRQPIPLPCSRAAPLLVGAAPALLRLGPTEMPVLEASNAVIVALLNHMLNLGHWNFLVDGLGRHGNWHVDDLPWHMHRDRNMLVAVCRRRRHGLGHIVLLRDVVLHDARWPSSLNLDDGAGILAASLQEPH